MDYRVLGSEEIPAAYEMARHLYPKYNARDLIRFSENGDIFLMGCFEQQEMLGAAMGDSSGNLCFIVVKETCRRQGIGRCLADRICQICAQRYSVTRVTVYAGIQSAAFFRKCGFYEVNQIQAAGDGTICHMEAIMSPDEIVPKKRNGILVGSVIAVCVLLALLLCILAAMIAARLPGAVQEFQEGRLEKEQAGGYPETPYSPYPDQHPEDTLPPETEELSPEEDFPPEAGKKPAYDPEPGYTSLPPDVIKEQEDELFHYESDTAKEFAEIWAYIAKDTGYTVEEENYVEYQEDGSDIYDFDVKYPQVRGLPGDTEDAVNRVLRDTAMKATDVYYLDPDQETKEFLDGLSYVYVGSDVDYKVTYLDKNLICVIFSDHYFSGDMGGECIEMRTATIDLNTAEVYTIGGNLTSDQELISSLRARILEEDPQNYPAQELSDDVFEKMIEGESVDGRYRMEIVLAKREVELAFSYLFRSDDGDRIQRGWTTVKMTEEEIKRYAPQTPMWRQYQAKNGETHD